jgi:hypothetical protein
MIVECPRCETDVDAKVLGTHDLEDTDGPPWRLTLAGCPQCGQPLLASQEMVEGEQGQWDWSSAEALWPTSELRPGAEVSDPVRDCLDEAHRCFKAKAFLAAEVMVARAIEAVCLEQTGESAPGRGLRALRDQGVIDVRLHEWGESLLDTRHRSGAHRPSGDDAKDLMDFALVLCHYVYVLGVRYNQYRARKGLEPWVGARTSVPPSLTLAPPPRPMVMTASADDVAPAEAEPIPAAE